MTTEQVVIDGEVYVRYRHVHALFLHTAAGMRFNRRHLRWFPGNGLLFDTEDEWPTQLLEREFGALTVDRKPTIQEDV